MVHNSNLVSASWWRPHEHLHGSDDARRRPSCVNPNGRIGPHDRHDLVESTRVSGPIITLAMGGAGIGAQRVHEIFAWWQETLTRDAIQVTQARPQGVPRVLERVVPGFQVAARVVVLDLRTGLLTVICLVSLEEGKNDRKVVFENGRDIGRHDVW